MPWKVSIGGEHCPCGLVQVTVSSREVYLPNASYIGYDTRHARPGHWVVWQEPGNALETSQGRVIGSIVEHCHPSEDLKGYLVVLNVGARLASTYIRYVNPELVQHCSTVNPKYVAFVLGLEFNEKTVKEIARLQSSGYLNDRGFETAIEKLYCSCKEHGTFKADGKIVTCPICGGRATND